MRKVWYEFIWLLEDIFIWISDELQNYRYKLENKR